jgi:hypothetical protein
VGLHYGFEVEARAVPEGEFAAAGGGQEAPAFGRPFYDVDGVFDLVEGGVQVSGGYGVGRLMESR